MASEASDSDTSTQSDSFSLGAAVAAAAAAGVVAFLRVLRLSVWWSIALVCFVFFVNELHQVGPEPVQLPPSSVQYRLFVRGA